MTALRLYRVDQQQLTICLWESKEMRLQDLLDSRRVTWTGDERFFVIPRDSLPNEIPNDREEEAKLVWQFLWGCSPLKEVDPFTPMPEIYPNATGDVYMVMKGKSMGRLSIRATKYAARYDSDAKTFSTFLSNLLPDTVVKKEKESQVQFIRPSKPIQDSNTEEAMAMVQEAINYPPTVFKSHNTLDDALPWGGFPNQICLIVYFKSAIRLDPENTDPKAMRAWFFDNFPEGAPSEHAVPQQFFDVQEGAKIYCGRWRNDMQWAYDAVPASLLDETLCELEYDFRTCEPTSEDIKNFSQIRQTLTQNFPTEQHRRDELIRVLTPLLPSQTHLTPAHIGKYTTDGDIRITAKLQKTLNFLLDVNQVKNEVAGVTSDPYFQAILYWISFLRQLRTCLTPDQEDKTNFPTVIITQFASYFCVSVATFGGSPRVEPLCTLSLHVHPGNDERIAEGVRMVCALRRCWHRLCQYYEDPFTAPHISCQAGFPFRLYYTTTMPTKIHFTYKRSLPNKRVFFAQIVSGNVPEGQSGRLCVKFSRRYSEEVHRFAADRNFAPRLWAVEKIFDWYMIVMEDESLAYTPVHKGSIDTKTHLAIENAMMQLHDADYVHGDLKDLNILVRSKTADPALPLIKLLDFDWAGKGGEAKYPFMLNPDILRHASAAPGGLICKEHDVFLVSQLAGVAGLPD